MPDIERRKFERVSCYLIAHCPRIGSDEYDFFGIVRNISAGGAMIEADESVAEGDTVEMTFLLEDERKAWEGRGRIVWSRRQNDKNIFGVQFTQPLEEDWRESITLPEEPVS